MSELSKVFVIARVELRRLFRDRTNIFFVLIFPIVLVLAIGTVFGGDSRAAIGVVAPGDPLAEEIVGGLRDSGEVEVHHYDSEGRMRDAVERGSLRAGVVLPPDYAERLRSGRSSDVEFLAGPTGVGLPLRAVVEAAVRQQAIDVQAAQFALDHGAATNFDDALETARRLGTELPPVEVRTRELGEELFGEDLGRFDPGASSQLILFMFVTGLAASAQLIQTRRLGVARRMLSTPTSPALTLVGEAAGRFAVTAFQGAYIMLATLVLFGVDWGDPIGALALLVVFALVSTGAAMLAGAIFHNEQQAGSVGVMFGLGLAALGGCMAPLQIFPSTMRTIAHITPHAWANEAFTELVDDHGTVVDILPNLAVLAAFATVLLTLGINRFRHTITTG